MRPRGKQQRYIVSQTSRFFSPVRRTAKILDHWRHERSFFLYSIFGAPLVVDASLLRINSLLYCTSSFDRSAFVCCDPVDRLGDERTAWDLYVATIRFSSRGIVSSSIGQGIRCLPASSVRGVRHLDILCAGAPSVASAWPIDRSCLLNGVFLLRAQILYVPSS